MDITVRRYASEADVRRMQQLAAEAWRDVGPRAEWHVGDVAWGWYQHTGRETEWEIAFWEVDGRLAAWTWFRRPSTLDWLVHPDHKGATLQRRLLEWFEERAEPGSQLRTFALEDDDATRTVLAEAGYEPEAGGVPYLFHVRELGDRPEQPAVPEGLTLRTLAGEEELARRVEVHRAAWEGSRVTEASYRNVMRAWPYRPDLDCVAELPDGRFAAYCLAWYDPDNRVGEFEPVATHPDFRGRGLGAAVCRYALGRLCAVGAELAVVYSAGRPEDEPARRLYESLGFRRHARLLPFVKQRP